jgi:hypothetical protein
MKKRLTLLAFCLSLLKFLNAQGVHSSCSTVIGKTKIQHVQVYGVRDSSKYISIMFKPGKGGIYENKDTFYLRTCRHIFSRNVDYYFVIHKKDTLYCSKTVKAEDDATIIQLSKHKQSFIFSEYKFMSDGYSIENSEPETYKVYSICKDSFDCIGYRTVGGTSLNLRLVIRKKSNGGESGTIFYDKDGQMYVLSGVFYVSSKDPDFQGNGLKDGEMLTTLTPIGFTLQYEQ